MHTSGAKARVASIARLPGINPRPTARTSFSASCDVGRCYKISEDPCLRGALGGLFGPEMCFPVSIFLSIRFARHYQIASADTPVELFSASCVTKSSGSPHMTDDSGLFDYGRAGTIAITGVVSQKFVA
jgi:hypothetical protein